MADEAQTLPGWPVVGLADLRLDSHPDLRFVAVTDGYRCSVVALADLMPCGALKWLIGDNEPEPGAIVYVFVPPELRRRGIATALLAVANAYAEAYTLPSPQHTDDRSPSGDGWARSLGAHPAVNPDPDEHPPLRAWGVVFADDQRGDE